MEHKNTKYFWIATIVILFYSTAAKAQHHKPANTNKQAKKEIKAEQNREKHKQSSEEKNAKKEENGINSKARYKAIKKKKEKNPEKKIR
jgi:hypothetical protein